ncbi:MAG: hypothetical protein B7Z74_10160, partial [Deltaproteobacteria bacterium 21-66-5]
LPRGYYALGEQHAGRLVADILTLHDGEPRTTPPDKGGVAVADAPPQVGRKMVASENAAYRALRRTLAIRHTSGHRLVALVEIVSPANKDRGQSVQDFVEKAIGALRAGCHLTVVDMFPPGIDDPHGLHGLIWEYFDPEDYLMPAAKPLTLASYCAGGAPEAYVAHIALDDEIPEMPLFLHDGHYVNLPLAATYDAAWRGVPQYWQDVLKAIP